MVGGLYRPKTSAAPGTEPKIVAVQTQAGDEVTREVALRLATDLHARDGSSAEYVVREAKEFERYLLGGDKRD